MTDSGGAARRSGRRWLLAVAGLAGLGAVAAVVTIWHLPIRMYPGTSDGAVQARAALQGGLLTAAAALTAVAGALIALDETRQANAETKRANGNTHVREFYATAIGLLGSASTEVRLGGLYALERIASDSPADQRTVVEVLSAFVREQTRAPGPDPAGTPPPPVRSKPETDVQAALTILGRLPDLPLDLRALLGRAPTRAEIRRRDMLARWGDPLREPRADLTGADLAGADLTDANLTAAAMLGANLAGAHLSGATLAGAKLTAADLTKASLAAANLTSARLDSTNLTDAALLDADLTRAELKGANLTRARLAGARLEDAGLEGANLTGAWLDGTDPADGVVTSTRHVAGLTQQQVDEATGDTTTRLPGHFRRPSAWG